ncbi:MAG: flagellar biosynthetic protein FliR, partial [Pseudomonadota bacterium]|nr:flagellar biosynthetic protein FliR [Pseudomonadota bacterium]
MSPSIDPTGAAIALGSLPLAALPGWAFAFVLVLARVGSAVMLLPGFGEADTPAVVRAGLTLALTLLLVPVIAPEVPSAPAGVMVAAAMVTAEVLTGLWLGWLARMLALALPLAGQFAAYMLGLASVLQPDADLGAQTTSLARLFGLAVPVIVL